MSGQRIHLAAIGSTNSYTSDLLSQSDIPSWTVVTADSQTDGRGQRGKSWQSEEAMNLLCSVVVRNVASVANQFLISIAASLSIVDLCADLGIQAQIKWPNDILIDDKKLGGLLIENQVAGDKVEVSIIGVGLNVNQTKFDLFDWPATSLALQSKGSFDCNEILETWLAFLKSRVDSIAGEKGQLRADYLKHVFKLNEQVSFNLNGVTTIGIIRGITSVGALILEIDGSEQRFVNGEIKLLRT